MIDTSDAPDHIQVEFRNMTNDLLNANGVPQEVLQECARLRIELMYHSWRYYWKDDPAVPDAEYDRLFRRLEALEKEYPQLETPLSPTQRVGVPMPPEKTGE
jgi:NAD-dependent DNA ligase